MRCRVRKYMWRRGLMGTGSVGVCGSLVLMRRSGCRYMWGVK